MMGGRQNLFMVNMVFTMIFNIILNAILIPRFSIVGAGVATMLSISFLALAQFIEVRIIFKMNPYSISLFKPVLAGIVSIIAFISLNALNLIHSKTLYSAVLFVVFYLVVLSLFGLQKEDRMIFNTLRKSI